MRKKVLFCLIIVLLCLVGTLVYGEHHTSEERGKAYFNDPAFSGGSVACGDCHPNGRGLEKSFSKKLFRIMGSTQNSLADAVNACLVGANKANAIDIASSEMNDIVSYIRSLESKAPSY